MKFGVFDHIERRYDVDMTQQFEERLQLVAQADAGGVYCYHVAEHHHSPLCLAPNQSVFLAAASQRTKTIKLGTLVFVLPFHHPLGLLEELCMVDRMSNGRVQIGVGPGAGGGGEIAVWGGDPATSRERFHEILEILIQGFQTDFLTYEGRHFQFKDLWMELTPTQKPHPPFWYAGNPARAAEFGMNFVGLGSSPRLAEQIALYKGAWKGFQEAPTPRTAHLSDPLYGGNTHLLICDSDAEARERAEGAYQAYRRSYMRPKPLQPGEPPPAPTGGAAAADAQAAIDRGTLIVGSASTVRDHVRAYQKAMGANYYVGTFGWGDLTHAEMSRSLRLFTEEVMPAFALQPA